MNAPRRFAPPRAHHVSLESDDVSFGHLAVRRVTSVEIVAQLPRWEVQLVSARDVDGPAPGEVARLGDELLGARVRLRFLDAAGAPLRVVSGMVASARRRADAGLARAALELVIVPRAWQLELISTQEIFMDQSVPEIVAAKLARVGLGHATSFRLARDYPKREFVVQYQESDLAFVSRLAEHLGISMFVEQGDEEEHLVFTDHAGGFGEERAVDYAPSGEGLGLTEIAEATSLVPAVHAVHDYNYRKPLLDLGASSEIDGLGGVVEYGSHHKTPDEGATLAATRAEEARARGRRFEARGHVVGLGAGERLRVEPAPPGFPNELLVVEARHHVEVPLFEGELAAPHVCELVAVSREHTYRPPRVTPRPRIHGVVTAVVEARPEDGPRAEARLDAEGRYTLSFHFDKDDRTGQAASRPVRMAQPFAGPDQGMHFPLRPGTEVLVAFVDGDPDRPLIVGAVPNPATPSRVSASDSHMHRIRSHRGLVIEFGRAQRGS